MPITDPWFYLAAVPAVLVTGIAKGGFGGLGIVAVPVLALTVSPARAVAILAPILILMDAFGVQTYWRDVDRAAMAVMLPGAVLGVALGGLMFDLLDARMMRLVLGALALAAPISIYLGVWLHHRIEQRLFMLLCYGLVALTGVKPIADGLTL